MSKKKKQDFVWTALLIGLSILVIILVVLAFQMSRANNGEPTDSGNSQSLTTESTGDTDPSGNGSSSTAEPTDPTATLDGLTYDSAIVLNSTAIASVELPALYAEEGYSLLYALNDGRLVLQNAKRISIFNPNSGEEVIVAEAAFGLQGAANDRFIVYGEGGDEVFELNVYTIANDSRSVILEDPNGYFGFELDEESHFYTSKVEALKYGKQMAGWIEYDLISGSATTHDGSIRSLGEADLVKADPTLNRAWSYETEQAWYEAWRLDAETSFAIEIEYIDVYRDLYRYDLYRIVDGLEPVFEGAEGVRPSIHMQGNLFVVDEQHFFYPETGRWYRLDNSDEALAALTISADGQGLYLAREQSADRWSDLSYLSLEGIELRP